jgi:hypothetical protein
MKVITALSTILVYFIMRGKIKIFVEVSPSNGEAEATNIPFIAYVEGSYFGDNDIFFQDESKGRDGTATAESEVQLLVLGKKDLYNII